MTDPDLVGTGWAYPLGLSARGGIRMVSGAAEIDAALRMILSTLPGERLMRPDFGCAMWDQVFAPVNANTMGLVEQSVRQAIERWEPRVTLERVLVTPQEDRSVVQVVVEYQIRLTNDRRNLVYPFYVIPQDALQLPNAWEEIA